MIDFIDLIIALVIIILARIMEDCKGNERLDERELDSSIKIQT